jgi:hypothetical protein
MRSALTGGLERDPANLLREQSIPFTSSKARTAGS